MYTRPYRDDGRTAVPEGYGGTLIEPDEAECESDEHTEITKEVFGGLGGLGRSISSLFGIQNGVKIGTEELLLAGIALFLLFSKNGDKECAIILLLSIFIAK